MISYWLTVFRHLWEKDVPFGTLMEYVCDFCGAKKLAERLEKCYTDE